jgi:hypothetical protein
VRLLRAGLTSGLWRWRGRTLASFARFSAECSHVEADSVVLPEENTKPTRKGRPCLNWRRERTYISSCAGVGWGES